jgi:hypothetical protein
MLWQLVIILKHREDSVSAGSFIAALANEIMKSERGYNPEMKVYEKSDTEADQFWLSPAIVASAPQISTLFPSTLRAEVPDLTAFKNVDLIPTKRTQQD